MNFTVLQAVHHRKVVMDSKLAVQMFTIRDYVKTAAGLAESIQKIAKIGYPAVQLSAVGAMDGDSPEVSVKEAARMLADNGIKCAATHRGWEGVRDNIQAEIDFHKTLGCNYLAIPGIPQGYDRTIDGYRRWVADCAEAIATLKAEGIRFAHHNHSHEFFRPERGGPTFEDIMIEEGGPDFLLELDLYWIAHAGVNCERILERCAGRVPFIHLKDKEVLTPTENETTMCPIGEGTMDWEHIIPACEKAGVDWYAVEQDECRRDPFDCLKSSFNYLTSLEI
jgi:sugar phosphate isomerase/epimerase